MSVIQQKLQDSECGKKHGSGVHLEILKLPKTLIKCSHIDESELTLWKYYEKWLETDPDPEIPTFQIIGLDGDSVCKYFISVLTKEGKAWTGKGWIRGTEQEALVSYEQAELTFLGRSDIPYGDI